MKSSRARWIAIILVVFIIILAGGFFIYVSDYYRADDTAANALKNDINIRFDGDTIILNSPNPSDTALVFYPGGKVEYTAYVPMLQKLAQKGIPCVLVKMPFHLAVLNPNAADKAFGKLQGIKNWYISGHSLGGAMASSYFSKNRSKARGLILLGAYIYGDIPASEAMTLYGSQDQVLNRSKITYTENVHVIEGGNHAYFGNYGAQVGDGTARISRETQQDMAVSAILDFIKKSNK